ncbi:hypothetical protein [Legionella nagasakiensis]|uniref:hypothetical protein n=1 Tax=Legionella nagasakiensis TaxID=535290 RepID=UPI001054A6F0|nr:hypothetical protein [Legionella nagasakiensis]
MQVLYISPLKVSSASLQNLLVLSHVAKTIYAYLQEHGASFFVDMVADVGHLRSKIEAGLWELVAAGLITADGFDNLRSLIDPRRRLRRRGHYPSVMGRWSLLSIKKSVDPVRQLEAACWILLKRYGVYFRELLVREKIVHVGIRC